MSITEIREHGKIVAKVKYIIAKEKDTYRFSRKKDNSEDFERLAIESDLTKFLQNKEIHHEMRNRKKHEKIEYYNLNNYDKDKVDSMMNWYAKIGGGTLL